MLRSLLTKQYFWLILGITAGALCGAFHPQIALYCKPLYEVFIRLIKTFIAPIIFCSIVHGIASAGGNRIGRLGVKIFVYFEVVSVVALVLGMVVANVIKPGAGMNIDPASIDASGLQGIYQKAETQSFLYRVVPDSMFASLANNEFIQILLISVLFGAGLATLKDRGAGISASLAVVNAAFFKAIGFIVKLVPIAAFGSVAFTMAKYGTVVFTNLFQLVLLFYITSAVFIFVILGGVLALMGINIFKLIRYIADEVLLVVSASSSEIGMPALIDKLGRLGCKPSTSSLVVTSGFSFNMDGSYIYLTLSYIFLSQALGIDISIKDQILILLVAMVTSKGAAGVAGSGFIALASTIAASPGQEIPVQSIALLLAIDQFMSLGRVITNYIGNGVAGLALSLWEKEVSAKKINAEMTKRS